MAGFGANPFDQLHSVADLRREIARAGAHISADDTVDRNGVLFAPVSLGSRRVGNRFCVLPLEGWDSDHNGAATETTVERWARLGRCGAKLLWGESVSVCDEGRNADGQLLAAPPTLAGVARAVSELRNAHRSEFGTVDDLVVGIQLHHGGRRHPSAPVRMQHHPFFDRNECGEVAVVGDEVLANLPAVYAEAAAWAAACGLDFVDVKACHGYLLHESLGARHRTGPYGGAFEGRLRLLVDIVRSIRRRCPALLVAVRFSAFDSPPFDSGRDGVGAVASQAPDHRSAYEFGMCTDGSEDLTESIQLVRTLLDEGVSMVCVTGSSPYAAWHVQRPSWSRGSSNYDTPEDPLVGVARHLRTTAAIKAAVPSMFVVGSAYSALQQWAAHVGQVEVGSGRVDAMGYARLHLASPTFAVDVGASQVPRIDRSRF